MTKNDTNPLKDELRPLKDLLEIIKDKVAKAETFQNVTMHQIRDIKDQQSVMNEKLDGITDRLDDSETGLERLNERMDSNRLAVIELANTINGYKESYLTNNANIRKLDKRLDLLEEDAGIDVPPELKLADVS